MTNTLRNSMIGAVALLVGVAIGWAAIQAGRAAADATVSEEMPDEQITHTLPGGKVTFTLPDEFGLAVKPEQILVESYIPVCSNGFDYCLSYNGGAYEGTNFDSAGVGIAERSDLTSKTACLNDQPLGYTNLMPATETHDGYSTSVFAVGDAGMGHASSGEVNRLWSNDTCHEFETRLNTSQFANYPAGTIVEFTDDDRQDVIDMLDGILQSVVLTGGAHPFAE